MDEVDCNGNETSLTQCSHRGWGVSNCGHWNDASVACAGIVVYSFHDPLCSAEAYTHTLPSSLVRAFSVQLSPPPHRLSAAEHHFPIIQQPRRTAHVSSFGLPQECPLD